MGVALSRPSGWPYIAENNSENFIDHKLLDGERILKKIPNFNFCQIWWPDFFGNIFLIFLDKKLHDTKRKFDFKLKTENKPINHSAGKHDRGPLFFT